MSELKPYIGPHPTDHTLTEYYLKSEADKVIAELDRQIKFLKITHDSCGNCNKCADGMGKVFDESLNKPKEQLRHQKFKRCLAMAEFCQYRSEMFFTWSKKMGFLLKWQNRWLEIAEQFKETK